ncbi:MAG: DUF2007 domain-containing protein [Anaerolineae bacterium]|nr:DUF2007 domain-containing protein [Anaerolineae bacterium]MDW8100120.1 DUF2007 domain-containing protein [Anaerolineae bacterium]
MSAVVLGLLSQLRKQAAQRAVRSRGGRMSSPPIEVYRAANEMEAQVVKGRLESEGIPTFLRREAIGPVFGFSVGALAEVQVLVPAPLAERARELLAETEANTEPEEL